jgi:hypothetical protein
VTRPFRYRGRSAVVIDVDHAVLGLSTHAADSQGYLRATLRAVEPVRDALRALSLLGAHGAGVPAAPTALADQDDKGAVIAWVTVASDALFFEAAAADGRAWLRIRVGRALLGPAADEAPGTTTVHLSAELARGLRRLRNHRSTTLVLGPGGAETHSDGSITAEHDPPWEARMWPSLVALAAGTPTAGDVVVAIPPIALMLRLRSGTGRGPLKKTGPHETQDLAEEPTETERPVRSLSPLLHHAQRVTRSENDDTARWIVACDRLTASLVIARREVRGKDIDAAAFVDDEGVVRARPLRLPAPPD